MMKVPLFAVETKFSIIIVNPVDLLCYATKIRTYTM